MISNNSATRRRNRPATWATTVLVVPQSTGQKVAMEAEEGKAAGLGKPRTNEENRFLVAYAVKNSGTGDSSEFSGVNVRFRGIRIVLKDDHVVMQCVDVPIYRPIELLSKPLACNAVVDKRRHKSEPMAPIWWRIRGLL